MFRCHNHGLIPISSLVLPSTPPPPPPLHSVNYCYSSDVYYPVSPSTYNISLMQHQQQQQYLRKRKPKRSITQSPILPVAAASSPDGNSETVVSSSLSPPPYMQQRNYRKHYCAIDIETGGPKVGHHPLVRIGVALVDENAVTIEKCAFPIPFDRNDFDLNCMRDFWQNEEKFPGISALLDHFEMQSRAVHDEAIQMGHKSPIAYALQKFTDYFDELQKRFAEVILVGDFIEFDYCVLNYYLSVYLNRPPINYYSRRSRHPVRAQSTSTFYHTICALLGNEWDTAIVDNDQSASSPTSCFATPLHRMIHDPSYRCIASMPSGRQKALAILDVNPHAIMPTQLKHDHNPENDAEEIVVVYVLAKRAWNEMTRRMQSHIHNDIVSRKV